MITLRGTPDAQRKSDTLAHMQKILIIALSILLVSALGVAAYFYIESRKDSTDDASREVEELVARVGRHIVLPEGETPTIATVSDPERLKDQPFFANAKEGDKALIYTGARKAYLYDPVEDKLLEVAPLTVGTDTSAEVQTTP